MSQEKALRSRLRVLTSLGEAVGALRSLSAQHFRAARAVLAAARIYRDEVDATLGVLAERINPAVAGAAPGLVVVAAELGLCGDYTTRVAELAASARRELGPGPVYCLGRRALRPLVHAGIAVDRQYAMPASLGALPPLLLPLVNQLLADRDAGRLGGLELVAARFEGAGQFRPVRRRVLPVQPPANVPPLSPSPYSDRNHLTAVLVREFVYTVLYQTVVDAMAAEHGKRLVVAESARSWLEERCEKLERKLAAIRREVTTQEVLEVAAGARSLRRPGLEEGAQ